MKSNNETYLLESDNVINIYDNIKRKTFNIPDKFNGQIIKGIGKFMFTDCKSTVENVTLPNTIETIKYKSFAKCSKISNLNFPESLKIIENGAFDNCGLENIILPSQMDTIGDAAFQKCEKLITVKMPNEIMKLGIAVFASCCSLKNVTLPNNITNIPAITFDDCTSMEDIVLPAKVVAIFAHAFSGCSNLKKIYFDGWLHHIESNSFTGCTSLQMLKLSKNCIISSAFDNRNSNIYSIQHTCPNVQFFYEGTKEEWLTNYYSRFEDFTVVCKESLINDIYCNEKRYLDDMASQKLNAETMSQINNVINDELKQTNDLNKKLKILDYKASLDKCIKPKQNQYKDITR